MTGQNFVKRLEKSPYYLLKRAAQFAADVYFENAGKNGLTQRQFTLMTAVDAFDGASQTDLVKRTGIDRSTLADMISRLVAQGYLQRSRSKQDGRTNVVSMTDAGRRALSDLQPDAVQVDKKILSVVPASRRKEFIEVLQILAYQSDGDDDLAPVKATAKPRKRNGR